ncbi:MAG: DUF3846 domain-containing protein [Gemmiger sp.]
MKVVICEPGQYARIAEIEPTLKAEQEIVGGLIDCVYPWPNDMAALVCNDEGKLNGLPLNRALEDYDVIAGTFFICGISGENFCSLTEEQTARYLQKFRDPEVFAQTPFGLLRMRTTPEEYQRFMVAKSQKQPNRHEPSR